MSADWRAAPDTTTLITEVGRRFLWYLVGHDLLIYMLALPQQHFSFSFGNKQQISKTTLPNHVPLKLVLANPKLDAVPLLHDYASPTYVDALISGYRNRALASHVMI